MNDHLGRNYPRTPSRFERGPGDPFPNKPWASEGRWRRFGEWVVVVISAAALWLFVAVVFSLEKM